MHSYLVSAKDEKEAQEEIDKLVKLLRARVLEFKITKIEEVRELNTLTKLKVTKPTVILIKNIENATTEALNAFLKNLEEPQQNLSYILTTSSIYKVLPTIVSRCQIVRTTNNNQQRTFNKEIQKFLEMSTGNKLRYVDTIRGKDAATSFAEQIILYTHQLLHKKDSNYLVLSTILTNTHSTLLALKANGNITLQLANLVVNYPL